MQSAKDVANANIRIFSDEIISKLRERYVEGLLGIAERKREPLNDSLAVYLYTGLTPLFDI